MNQRGCGPGSPITRGLAHAGRAGDLAVVLADLQERWPSLPIDVVGISFGGHLALSLACSELPEATLPRCIVAVSPPLHLARASERISTALGGLYRRHFVAALIAEAERRARCFGEALPRLDPAGSVRDFDARYTAPRSGFASVDDYYTRCSTLERLGHVRIPTQIWSAQDDPLVPFEDLTRHRANQNLTEWRIAGGGHLGFLGRPWNGGFHWWERQVLRHLSRRPSASDEPEDRAIVPAPSRNGR